MPFSLTRLQAVWDWGGAPKKVFLYVQFSNPNNPPDCEYEKTSAQYWLISKKDG